MKKAIEFKNVKIGDIISYTETDLGRMEMVELEPTKTGKSVKYKTANGYQSVMKATTIVYLVLE